MDDDEAISQPSSAAISPRISLTMSTCGAPPAVETDEPDDPLHRGALRVHGVVVEKEHLSHVIEQVGVWISGRGKHIIPPWWGSEIADNRLRANLPENQFNIALSGRNGL
jgi:hypothetical protein